jgi:hypothetical protein
MQSPNSMLLSYQKPQNAIVQLIIENSHGKWPTRLCYSMDGNPNNTPMDLKPCANWEDKVIWTDSADWKYSIWSAWEELRSRKERVEWPHLVWYSKAIPRFSFILCLIYMTNWVPKQATCLNWKLLCAVQHGRGEYWPLILQLYFLGQIMISSMC